MNYIVNSVSANMVQWPCTMKILPVSRADAAKLAVGTPSAIGHADTAAVVSADLGLAVACDRKTLSLTRGNSVLLAQYRGPRLPEGATKLPEGARIDYAVVDFS